MSVDKRKAIQKATALIQQGRLDKAIAEYEAILAADPSDPSLYNALGDLYAQSGSASQAIACYLKLAEVLKAEGLLHRAIAVYKKIVKLDANNVAALCATADLYAGEGFRAEAKHQYLLAAERSLKLGFVKQALELYERLIRLEPGDTSIAAKLASLLEGEGRRSEATDLLGRLAEEVRAQGRLDDARRLYQQMAEIAPEAVEPASADASHYLASWESMALTHDAAAPEIEVVQSEPVEGEGPAAFTAMLAELEHTRGSEKGRAGPPQARPEDEKAPDDSSSPVDRSPEICEAHYQLGMAYKEMGLLDDAIAEFRRSAADGRLSLPACNMIGLCLLAKGDVEAAIHELGRGLSIVGRPAEEYLGIKYDLAIAHLSIGDLATAEAILRDLQAESPSFRDVKSQVMKLRTQLAQGALHHGAPKETIDGTRQARSR